MRPCINTSDLSYTKIINGMAEMLEHYECDIFATLSTHYPMKLPAARRAATKLHSNLNKHFPGTQVFFAIEPFDSWNSNHIHSLINFDNFKQLTESKKKSTVNSTWQSLTKGRQKKEFNWTKLYIYDKRLGARHYLAKYIQNHNVDWDILV